MNTAYHAVSDMLRVIKTPLSCKATQSSIMPASQVTRKQITQIQDCQHYREDSSVVMLRAFTERHLLNGMYDVTPEKTNSPSFNLAVGI